MAAEKLPVPVSETDHAIDNIRKMFRMTMATNGAKPGETSEQTRERIAKDPETAKVAATLKCTVEQLLEGWGQTEQLHVFEGYDHAEAVKEVNTIVEKVAQMPVQVYEGELAHDKREKSGTQQGPLAAPNIGERRSAIFSDDEESSVILKSQMQAARTGKVGMALGQDDDEEEEIKPKKKGPKGAAAKPGAKPTGKAGKPQKTATKKPAARR